MHNADYASAVYGAGVDADVDLKALAKLLVVEGMPVQAVIAREAGVSQPTVSRAVHGLIKRPSAGARKLWTYGQARMRVLASQPASDCTNDPLSKRSAAEGRSDLGSPAGRRRRATPARQVYNQRDGTLSRIDRSTLAREALEGLKHYLDDAFDPRLVIDQLAVLRRAQDPSHRRTEERPPSTSAQDSDGTE